MLTEAPRPPGPVKRALTYSQRPAWARAPRYQRALWHVPLPPPRGDLDPVYFNCPYYIHPDGPIAVEALRVISAAMAEAGVVGIGRLTLSRRERMVMVEPHGAGMVAFTLRAADEVPTLQFASTEVDLDAEMVAIAGAIIKQRTGIFDSSTYRDRYQEALRELIEAKIKGIAIKPRAVSAPPPIIDLMVALKRSLAQQAPATKGARASKKNAPRRHLIGASRRCSYQYQVAEG